ncbi:MAG: ABC transporter ATP-binding protein [Bacteroidota bacterium]|nr:ABC transporter ATP-binding protein [Bacteroidota bacterium]
MANLSNKSLLFLLKKLWKEIKREKKIKLVLVFILSIISSFTEVLSIGSIIPFLAALSSPEELYGNDLTEPFIVFFGISGPDKILMPFTLLFCLCVVLSALMRLLLLWIQSKLTFSIGNDISISVYKKTLYQPYSFHVSRNSSEVIATIANKVNAVVSNVIFSGLILISSALMILIITSALISINPIMVFTGFFSFGIMYYILIFLAKKSISTHSEIINSNQVNIIKALQEGLGGIRDVLINGTQETYFEIYQDSDIPLRNAQAKVEIISGGPRFILEALGMIFIAVLALSFSSKTSGLNSVIPTLGAIALGAQRLLPIMQMAYSKWTAMNVSKETLKDTLELLIQKIPPQAINKNLKPLSFKEKIKLNNISFKYVANSPFILNKVDIEINKGDRIGFVGTTGSGKSTILDLIMGLLEPSKGFLTVDDKVISKKNIRNWQARIAHVPQQIFLSDTSIAENIAFGIPKNKIDFERVKKSAKKAQIHRTIESWEKKYQTFVGERGIRLSGGQRQRIGIARALYKNADVIVFDEATSALDTRTEDEVMKAIENLSKELTIMIVAHRTTTLKKCSKIIDLKDGKSYRIGDYSDIINN